MEIRRPGQGDHTSHHITATTSTTTTTSRPQNRNSMLVGIMRFRGSNGGQHTMTANDELTDQKLQRQKKHMVSDDCLGTREASSDTSLSSSDDTDEDPSHQEVVTPQLQPQKDTEVDKTTTTANQCNEDEDRLLKHEIAFTKSAEDDDDNFSLGSLYLDYDDDIQEGPAEPTNTTSGSAHSKCQATGRRTEEKEAIVANIDDVDERKKTEEKQALFIQNSYRIIEKLSARLRDLSDQVKEKDRDLVASRLLIDQYKMQVDNLKIEAREKNRALDNGRATMKKFTLEMKDQRAEMERTLAEERSRYTVLQAESNVRIANQMAQIDELTSRLEGSNAKLLGMESRCHDLEHRLVTKSLWRRGPLT